MSTWRTARIEAGAREGSTSPYRTGPVRWLGILRADGPARPQVLPLLEGLPGEHPLGADLDGGDLAILGQVPKRGLVEPEELRGLLHRHGIPECQRFSFLGGEAPPLRAGFQAPWPGGAGTASPTARRRAATSASSAWIRSRTCSIALATGS